MPLISPTVGPSFISVYISYFKLSFKWRWRGKYLLGLVGALLRKKDQCMKGSPCRGLWASPSHPVYLGLHQGFHKWRQNSLWVLVCISSPCSPSPSPQRTPSIHTPARYVANSVLLGERFAGGRWGQAAIGISDTSFLNLVRNPTQSSSCALAINHPFCINGAPSKKKTTKHQCLYHVLILKVRCLMDFDFFFPLSIPIAIKTISPKQVWSLCERFHILVHS